MFHSVWSVVNSGILVSLLTRGFHCPERISVKKYILDVVGLLGVVQDEVRDGERDEEEEVEDEHALEEFGVAALPPPRGADWTPV